jgi:cytochrome P450
MDRANATEKPDAEMRFGRAPGAWPVLGHVAALRRRPLGLLDSLSACGDLVEIRLGPRPAFVLCHPDLTRQVLTDFRGFDRTGLLYDRVRMAMGNGLATASREDHRRQRLIMQPSFGRAYLRGYVDVMHREITATMERWRQGDHVDMVGEMFKLTTGVALRALFSARLDTGEAEQLRQAFDIFLRGIYARAVLPVAGSLPTPGNRRYVRAVADWRDQVARLINGYRLDDRLQTESGSGDLMSRLLMARDEDGQGMSDAELADQVAVLVLAGGETTSAAVVWGLSLLSDHPRVLDALQAEADAVLGRRVGGWDDLPRLDLTARVVREALRLYPPAWAIPRTVARETTLAGHVLPAGSMVIFSPYVVHRRPDVYPDPLRFDPDRWLPPAYGAAAVRRASYLPFGAGPTKCIGQDFGFAEATLILASIAARWNVLPDTRTVTPAVRAVLVPRAFRVHLSRR